MSGFITDKERTRPDLKAVSRRQDAHNPNSWNPKAVMEQNRALENHTAAEVIRWGFETFGTELVTATGFGPSGIVVMHLLSKIVAEPTVFYLETDLLFEETYTLRDTLVDRLGLKVMPVHSGVSLWRQAQQHGPDLWARNPDYCCFIRKMLPLRGFLADKSAWITALRRDQSSTRSDIEVVEWDSENGLVKINPLAGWTSEEIWQYIHLYDLPYNSLHDQGYPSLGCRPCTQPALDGAGARSGRWTGFAKTECGIHRRLQVIKKEIHDEGLSDFFERSGGS